MFWMRLYYFSMYYNVVRQLLYDVQSAKTERFYVFNKTVI